MGSNIVLAFWFWFWFPFQGRLFFSTRLSSCWEHISRLMLSNLPLWLSDYPIHCLCPLCSLPTNNEPLPRSGNWWESSFLYWTLENPQPVRGSFDPSPCNQLLKEKKMIVYPFFSRLRSTFLFHFFYFLFTCWITLLLRTIESKPEEFRSSTGEPTLLSGPSTCSLSIGSI